MENLEQYKDAMRRPWIVGDFDKLSRAFGLQVAQDFVDGLDLAGGGRVLDIACGSGSTALPLARRGARVTGIDIAPKLLAKAREAASAASLDIRFDEGFAEELPYQDNSFDIAVSMFGVEFSPFHEQVVNEIDRVLAPGGRLVLANWAAGGFSGEAHKVFAAYMPPPEPNAPQRFNWGDAAAMRALLMPHFPHVETRTVTFRWDIAFEPSEAAAFMLANAGPLLLLYDNLPPDRQAPFRADLARHFTEWNEADAGSGRTIVRNEYLEVRATRP